MDDHQAEMTRQADDLIIEMQGWLRERGYRLDRPHVTQTGAIKCRVCRLPEGNKISPHIDKG